MRKFMLVLVVTLYGSVAIAGSDWQHCDLASDVDFLPSGLATEGAEIDVKADHVQLVEDGNSVFTGNVEVIRGNQTLTANQASYNQISGNVTAKNNVQIRDSEMILNAEQAEWDLSKNEGNFTDADYRLREGHARGEATHVVRYGATRTKLKNATYTTCPTGNDTWLLSASNVNLNHEEAVGVARDVVVRLRGFPIFYTPYISFPLNDERKSGFLIPSIGNSDETGFDVRTPYYWNIADNKDATLTSRYMSERGLMLKGEFRYLDEQTRGKIDASFLASDNLKNDNNVNPYYDEDRKHFSLQYASRLALSWDVDIDYNYVSDRGYLEDFGSNLSLVSTTHIDRKLKLSYSGDNWAFTGRLQGYQTLTDATKPYQRLPQLVLQGVLPDQFMGLTYGLTTQYVAFDHADKVNGQRFDIEPSISLPWRSSAAFIMPRIALHHTRYDLDESVYIAGDKTPTRTLAVTSIDSGLFFERDMKFGRNEYIHTLEPRAFYLYIPDRNQSDIPIFDSSLRTFNLGQLFSYDRFSGTDRMGDANQLSLALTSRIINQKTGQERLRASLGQIQYFSDRNVTLANTAKETQSDSDMVAEIVASITKEWTVRGEMQWDPHGDTSNLSALQLRYKGDKGRLLAISHRYRRDDATTLDGLEQIDISTRIPFNYQWSVVGRWYHSLKDNRALEGLAGIEYENCCWSARLVARDYINNVSDDDRNLAIFFQFELKGLGSFGEKTETLLQNSILGYGS